MILILDLIIACIYRVSETGGMVGKEEQKSKNKY